MGSRVIAVGMGYERELTGMVGIQPHSVVREIEATFVEYPEHAIGFVDPDDSCNGDSLDASCGVCLGRRSRGSLDMDAYLGLS